jgi:hypothetical protein
MLKNGWKPSSDEPVITPQGVVLNYEKAQREAMVTIYLTNDITVVAITIEQK